MGARLDRIRTKAADLGEALLDRVVAAIRANPRRAIVLVLLVLALAGRGAPPAVNEVEDLCTGIIGAAVMP
jgi:hypothetical protein